MNETPHRAGSEPVPSVKKAPVFLYVFVGLVLLCVIAFCVLQSLGGAFDGKFGG